MMKLGLRLSGVFLFVILATQSLPGDEVVILNPGFEDTSGQTVFDEFTFGTPAGWEIYDPDGIHPSAGLFTGTLQPNGVDFFNSTAPEGDRVGILFNSSREGDGVYGFEQILSETLELNTDYELTVEVGNIGSGTSSNGTFFNLDEFPGYQVDLMAGGVVIASDLNTLNIPEAEFLTSTVSFSTNNAHALAGQNLGIRLTNLNVIPPGFTQDTSPDLEVDFDQVRLSRTSNIPEPGSSCVLLLLGTAGLLRRRRSS